MSRKPIIESDPTAVIIRIGGSSVRLSPAEAEEHADRVRAVAAELRKAIAEAPRRKAEIMGALKSSVAVRRPRGS